MPLFREITSKAFDEGSVDASTQQLNELVEAGLATAPPIHEQNLDEVRQSREDGTGPFGPLVLSDQAETRTIRGPDGDVPLRIFRAPEPQGVYLHIHGGGWTIGRAHHYDPALEPIAAEDGVSVVSVDYRLAPEHPYPAAPDDCEAAAVWLLENAEREFGSSALAIGGESAGAHLAAVTLLRMRDRHGATPFRAANLVYGCYDLAMTPSVRRWGDRNLILSTPIIEWFRDNFLAGRDPDEPDISPLLADLTGMPPALFTVGTLDPLLDDSLFLHGRWIAAGRPAEIALSPGSIHAFTAFPNPAGEEAVRNARAFVRRRLSETA